MPGMDMPDKQFSLLLQPRLGNERCVFKKPGTVLVISDIEGSFKAFLKFLIRNKVIDRHLRWIFKDGHLVIVGDCFDRGEQVVECLWLIYSLEEKARRHGGYVHFILGNHEIMNMNGDWRYVHPKYAQSSRVPFTAIYSGNNELWHWLCTKNIVEVIGDVLFVHGGISNDLLKLNLSVKEINNLARPWYNNARNEFADPVLKLIYNSEKSPFWYRGYYQQEVTEEQIDDTLKFFGVNTIVTGHTMMDRVTPYFNGKVINVDTDHASGNSEALLINGNSLYRINRKGKKEKIK